MAKPLFSEIFGAYFGEELNNALSGCTVEGCKLSMEERTLELALHSSDYINRNVQTEIINTLKSVLRLINCAVLFTFEAGAFCETAWSDIATEIKLKNAALNGYFAEAD